MSTAILAIILFLIMIFPHELGHFIAAKKCGIQVNEFSFGMGPVIWKKQKGETQYSIRLLPIGGFCAMEGENGDEEKADKGEITVNKAETGVKEYNERAFNNKKPWQKIIVLAAGSFMNVVCAILIMTLLAGIQGFPTKVIQKVEADSPAYESGIMPGDEIVGINGNSVNSWEDVVKEIAGSRGETLGFTILRKGDKVEVKLKPKEVTQGEQKGYFIGISAKSNHNPFKAIVSGVKITHNMTKTMLTSIKQLFTGEVSTKELAGPVGMISMVNKTSTYGGRYFGFLTAMICLNLAIINMLPFPALDGGRILFVIYSWITKKSISAKVEGTIHAIGLILLMGLMLYATKNDIFRLFG